MAISEEQVQVTIGRPEALILFELLADFYSQSCLQVSGPAERLALIRLQGSLEKALTEPFMPEYGALIDEARARLMDQSGTL